MKSLHLVFFALFLTICCSTLSAQSVIVTHKKVIYKRTGKDVSDYKRTFEVRYPIFSGKISSSALRNLKSGTNYWNVFEYINLADSIKNDDWLSSFDYEVKYNRDNILSIWLTMEGVGAYPDSSIKYLVFDLRSGRKLELQDLFQNSQLIQLRNELRKKMRQIEKTLEQDVKEQLEFQRNTHREMNIPSPSPDTLKLSDLEGFTVGARGVTFHYDYSYPHVVKALEPPGEFFLTWKELKLYIKSGGLLAKLAR